MLFFIEPRKFDIADIKCFTELKFFSLAIPQKLKKNTGWTGPDRHFARHSSCSHRVEDASVLSCERMLSSPSHLNPSVLNKATNKDIRKDVSDRAIIFNVIEPSAQKEITSQTDEYLVIYFLRQTDNFFHGVHLLQIHHANTLVKDTIIIMFTITRSVEHAIQSQFSS